MVDEAGRPKGGEINPLLRTILESEEVRQTKRDIAKQIGNDIYKNSVRRVYRGNNDESKAERRPYISLDDDSRLLSPSERLLRMVAAIVHKANAMERTARKIKQQKKKMMRKQQRKTTAATMNPLGILTVDEQPKQRFVDKIFGMNRIKRSLIRLGTDLDDMRSFVDQINHRSDEDSAETTDEEQHVSSSSSSEQDEIEIDDYLNDDDYYYDDEEEQEDGNNSQSLHYQPRPSNNIFDDYEDGSIMEFIELARQRDRREQQMHETSDEVDDDDDYSLENHEWKCLLFEF